MLQPEGNYLYTNAHFTQCTIYSTVASPSLNVSTKFISTVHIDFAFLISPAAYINSHYINSHNSYHYINAQLYQLTNVPMLTHPIIININVPQYYSMHLLHKFVVDCRDTVHILVPLRCVPGWDASLGQSILGRCVPRT
jgi:hypothetical protein